MDVAVLLAAGIATALATGLGAVPVFLLGVRVERLRPALLGGTAGLMGVASIVGLLMPALDDGSASDVALGLGIGIVFLAVTRRLVERRDREPGAVRSERSSAALLVFIVLFVHSLPEGFAIGTAYASDTAGLSLFVILAIAFQNVPEGTAVAIPMEAAGATRVRQFWAAVGTSVPQPIGALVAYALVEEIDALLPISFAFAAGAMLALVAVDIAPQALRANWRGALAGASAGGALMLALSAALGV